MSSDWTYLAEYYAAKNRPTRLRAVYRSRPREGGGFEDFIFTKNGWRPSANPAGIRLGYGEHLVTEIPEDEAERLTQEIRDRRLEMLRAGVEEMVEILRAHDMAARAEQLQALYDSRAGGPHIEEQLYDLATDTSVPPGVRDEDTILRFNRAQAAVQGMTQESQR